MSTFVPSYSLLHSIGAVALSSLVIGCLAEPDEVIDESTEPGTIGESEAVAAPKATGPLGGALWSTSDALCTHAGAKAYTGDFNGDGRDDLLCHDSNGGIWIDRASATGGFERHDWFGDTNFCTHAGAKLLLTDVSGDGRGDLVCHDDGGATWVDRATATGTFSGHDFFSDEFCEAPATVYAGRFSSDGRADLLCHGDGTLAIATSGL
jgi:hypothetical protein